MYMTLKLDDSRCRIHSISDDGNGWIVTNERYVVMPWKMVTRHGTNMTLAEVVDGILSQKESEAKECKRRNREQKETEKKHKEYYEAHMKEEMERLNKLVDWYKCKLKEINEAPVDSRPRKLEKLYQYSEANKDARVMITRAGTLAPVEYPKYPPELELPEDNEDNVEIAFYDAPKASSLPAGYKPFNQLDYFRQLTAAYNRYDSDAVKYVKKVKALIDKPLDEIQLEDVRLAMTKVKCPCKLDISVFYQLTGRLPHGQLEYDDERIITHLYNTFCNESIKLLGKTVRYRVNVLYHLLAKIGKECNADLFQFMKGPSHQRTEEETKFVFEHLGWNYSLIQLD